MPLHNDLDLLKPSMKAKVQAALDEMNSDEQLKAWNVASVVVQETLRDLDVQMAYYSRGRMHNAADPKLYYKAAGLWNISDREAVTAITWTLDSKHIRGEAADLVPARAGQLWWNAPKHVWERIGEIGEKHGLSWGGRWPGRQNDSPHFESS